jgi:glucan biosynthesis protein C
VSSAPSGSGAGAQSSDGQSDASSIALSRLYFLDWIRIAALLTVFFDHFWSLGLTDHLTFIPAGPLQDAVWLKSIFVIIPPVGIAVFFLVSGAASMMSLERRSSKEYVMERVLRLAIPYVIGSVLLVPLASWLMPWNGFSGSLWEYYPVYFADVFNGLSGYGASTIVAAVGQWLWVLGFLFAFSVIGLPILQWLRSPSADRFVAWTTRIARRRGGLLLWVVPVTLVTVVGQLVADGADGADAADVGLAEYFGWGAFLRYFAMFLLGAILIRNSEVLEYVRRDGVLAGAVLLVVVAGSYWYLVSSSAVQNDANFTTGVLTAAGVLISVACWCLALLLMAVGMRFLNTPSKALAYCLGIIVAFYVLHQVAINAVEYLYFGRIDLDLLNAGQYPYPALYLENQLLVGVVLFLAALLLLIVFIELVVRPILPLRNALGVTRERIPGRYRGTTTADQEDAEIRDHDKSALDQHESSTGESSQESDVSRER